MRRPVIPRDRSDPVIPRKRSDRDIRLDDPFARRYNRVRDSADVNAAASIYPKEVP